MTPEEKQKERRIVIWTFAFLLALLVSLVLALVNVWFLLSTLGVFLLSFAVIPRDIRYDVFCAITSGSFSLSEKKKES